MELSKQPHNNGNNKDVLVRSRDQGFDTCLMTLQSSRKDDCVEGSELKSVEWGESLSVDNTNKEPSNDANETAQQDFVQFAAMTTSTERRISPFVHTDPDLLDPHDVLSEDEADVHTLKRISHSKIMSWNDGSKNLVAKHVAVHRPQQESLDGITNENTSQPISGAPFEVGDKPQTIQPFEKDPLKGMVPIEPAKTCLHSPSSPLMGVSGTPQCQDDADKDTQEPTRSYTEAVTRTPNADTGTVTVSALRRKRRGKRGQPSYFDITSELHYLR